MTSADDAYSRLRREVQRATDGLRAPLSETELDAFARELRPDADACRVEIQEGEDGPLIVVRAVKRPRAEPVLGTLTPREREVALCVARGLTNPAIARELAIQPSTVKDHVHNILERLGLRSRTQLAALVTRETERATAERPADRGGT